MSRAASKAPRGLFALLFVGAFLLAVTVGVDALSQGVFREDVADQDVDLSIQGCSCHNPSASPEVIANVDAPARYEAGETYQLNVTWTGGPEPVGIGNGNNGGFNLLVTGGELAAPEGDAANWVQINGDHNEATHTGQGEQETIRNFTLLWTAPEDGANVMFVLTANSVNGNGAPEDGDLWNQLVTISQPAEPEIAVEESLGGGAAEAEINHLGVHYLAYWVGVISFALLFIMYGLTFFVFRFNESRHATDHKDRAK